MIHQLSLPAGWARGIGLVGHVDPREQLDRMERDKLDTKVEVRRLLDDLAERYGVAPKEVNRAMNWIDDALEDLVYEVRRDIDRELEDRDRC